jgi:hypothetical protein
MPSNSIQPDHSDADPAINPEDASAPGPAIPQGDATHSLAGPSSAPPLAPADVTAASDKPAASEVRGEESVPPAKAEDTEGPGVKNSDAFASLGNSRRFTSRNDVCLAIERLFQFEILGLITERRMKSLVNTLKILSTILPDGDDAVGVEISDQLQQHIKGNPSMLNYLAPFFTKEQLAQFVNVTESTSPPITPDMPGSM